MAPLRIAIAGFRHAHILDLYRRVSNDPRVELVALCEENFAASLLPVNGIAATHTSFESLLREVDCDVIALGDSYGRRGAQAIRALTAGKHVLADKPLCTRSEEWDAIRALATRDGPRIGMMLDLRDLGNMIALRESVLRGRIGSVQSVVLAGLHPLLYGTRPAWYFEPGMHGGTLCDIGTHAMDFLPWLTGFDIAAVEYARTWNAKAAATPGFEDCAQFVMRLENGAGVIGDVSYLAPEACGYTLLNYWKITIHGTRGFAETSFTSPGVTIADDDADAPLILPPSASRPGGWLEDFLADVEGAPRPHGLDTDRVLTAMRWALDLQSHADHRLP